MDTKTFEKALMECLRGRGTLRSGFLEADGLSESEMASWGTALQGRLLAYELRYRGAQHLLNLSEPSKEPRGFRAGLKREASEICLMLLENRERLHALERFKQLYDATITDLSWSIGEAGGMLIRRNLQQQIARLSEKAGAGTTTDGSWSTVLFRLELGFGRGLARRTFARVFEVDDTGETLRERLDSAVALWREIERCIKEESSKPGCWPDEQAQAKAEESRALSLIDTWMKALNPTDRQAIREHGATALSRWKARL